MQLVWDACPVLRSMADVKASKTSKEWILLLMIVGLTLQSRDLPLELGYMGTSYVSI